MIAHEIRDPALLREELEDLLNYLNGLPDLARRTGAFTAYEQRVGELSRELVLSDMHRSLDFQLLDHATLSAFGHMSQGLSEMTERNQHAAAQSLMVGRALQLCAFSALATTIVYELPFSGLLAASLLLCEVLLTERARKQEHVATRLSVLHEEIAHSFGPAGQVLRPSEYYSATTKRIESLLDEIRTNP